jgi:hypothetical protein
VARPLLRAHGGRASGRAWQGRRAASEGGAAAAVLGGLGGRAGGSGWDSGRAGGERAAVGGVGRRVGRAQIGRAHV